MCRCDPIESECGDDVIRIRAGFWGRRALFPQRQFTLREGAGPCNLLSGELANFARIGTAGAIRFKTTLQSLLP
jgi:hypothetical protein